MAPKRKWSLKEEKYIISKPELSSSEALETVIRSAARIYAFAHGQTLGSFSQAEMQAGDRILVRAFCYDCSDCAVMGAPGKAQGEKGCADMHRRTEDGCEEGGHRAARKRHESNTNKVKVRLGESSPPLEAISEVLRGWKNAELTGACSFSIWQVLTK